MIKQKKFPVQGISQNFKILHNHDCHKRPGLPGLRWKWHPPPAVKYAILTPTPAKKAQQEGREITVLPAEAMFHQVIE
jgi:hypothetical protein